MNPLPKIQAASAQEICARFAAPPGVKQKLRAGMSPGEFVEALIEAQEFLGGIDFLAHALPEREGIWWGCLYLQHASGGRLKDVERTACRAAVQWIFYASAANRSAAKAPADAAGPNSPGGLLAMATSRTTLLSVNSLPDGPAAPAVAASVASSIKVAGMYGGGSQAAARLRTAVELGIGIAEGQYLR